MCLQLPDGSQPALPSGPRWGSWRVAVDSEGGSVRVSYFFLGGVSEFHHCFLSCRVMLGKLPDIAEP